MAVGEHEAFSWPHDNSRTLKREEYTHDNQQAPDALQNRTQHSVSPKSRIRRFTYSIGYNY
jgi:hypothetical protein